MRMEIKNLIAKQTMTLKAVSATLLQRMTSSLEMKRRLETYTGLMDLRLMRMSLTSTINGQVFRGSGTLLSIGSTILSQNTSLTNTPRLTGTF